MFLSRRVRHPTPTSARSWRVLGALRGALLLVFLAPAASAAPADAERLYRLLDQRLELMDEVAAYKWHRHLDVENAEREAVVLEQAVNDARRYGFTPDSSRAFFRAQIEAAKVIQRYWFARWQAGARPPDAPDLNAVVRPELLRLGGDIVAAAAQVTLLSRPAFDAAVSVEGLSDEARERMFHALSGLARFHDRLQQILATGELRVATTGDYAPFSYVEDGRPAGIDLDLADDLAAALGVKVVLVQTTWSRLLGDLAVGRYDIAMGGVSRTLERQKQGYQSHPYYTGGKAAIARCKDADRYGSLAAIDRPGVRVIVNPGGTNERFVDANLHRAAKILHPDNRTIFDALAAGDGDVMITDRVEVELQTAQHPELCAATTGTLNRQEKAYLMPQDEPLREFVDTWLDAVLADGTVAEAFRRHGVRWRPAE